LVRGLLGLGGHRLLMPPLTTMGWPPTFRGAFPLGLGLEEHPW
jgi:hypothetical protein